MARPESSLGLPSQSAVNLLKARLLPIGPARAAWKAWCETADIDTASWREVRLLAGVGARMDQLDPDSPLRPRMEGIRRFIWTRNQLRLGHSMPFLEVLAEAGIPFMLLKGGARIALSPQAVGERFIRDIDILVAQDRVSDAVEAILKKGFRPMTGRLPGSTRASPFDHVYGGGVTGREGCEIDLHYAALRYGRWGDFDGPLWARSVGARLRGIEFRVPSASDQFVIAIVHGLVGDVDAPADWVLDAVDARARAGFSWTTVVGETKARKIGVAMAVGTTFLETEFGVTVPPEIRRALGVRSSHFLGRREFEIETRLSSQRSLLDGYILGMAEALRSHRLVRPLAGPRTSYSGRRRGRKELNGGGQAVALPGEFEILAVGGGRPSDIEINLGFPQAPPPARYSFDVLVDGRWSARLKVRPNKLDAVLGRKAWRFRLPVAAGGKHEATHRVKIVPLGEGYAPLDEAPFEARAELMGPSAP